MAARAKPAARKRKAHGRETSPLKTKPVYSAMPTVPVAISRVALKRNCQTNNHAINRPRPSRPKHSRR